MSPPVPATLSEEDPWPGLAPFREQDRNFFHGRDEEAEALQRQVLRDRLTVLFGLSGLGKTSLLHAGLFPRLRDHGVLPVSIRLDFADGAAGLRAQVRAAITSDAVAAGIEPPVLREGDTLWELLHRRDAEFWSQRNQLVTPLLVFDQFEECFTLGHRGPLQTEASLSFLAELADLVEGRPTALVEARMDAAPEETSAFNFDNHRYKVLVSLREDFLPQLASLQSLMPSLSRGRIRLRAMSREQALVVVSAAGNLVAQGVAEHIVRFVAGDHRSELAELYVEPALLSVVCHELNHRRRSRGEERIDARLVEGTRDEILAAFYERGLQGLGSAVRTLLEERLLTVSGYRESLAVETAVATPGVTRDAIDQLVLRRLLRLEERGGVARLELTHDVLTGVVRTSRDVRREREARQAAEQALAVRAQRLRRRWGAALAACASLGAATALLATYGVEWARYRERWRLEAARTDIRGKLTAFGCSSGESAFEDSVGKHGVYTGALLRYLDDPLLSVGEILLKANADVGTSSVATGPQTPEYRTSLTGDIFLHSPPAGRRSLALVVGNGKYGPPLSTLQGPVYDAQAVESRLRAHGYQPRLLRDGTKKQIEAEIDELERQIEALRPSLGELQEDPGSSPRRGLTIVSNPPQPVKNVVVIVYFGGHGFHADGRSYFLPTDVRFGETGPESIVVDSIDLGRLQDRLAGHAAVVILIVDASCTQLVSSR